MQVSVKILSFKSPEPPEKLAELHDLCVKWGTVTNTVINGLTPQGELVIEPISPLPLGEGQG